MDKLRAFDFFTVVLPGAILLASFTFIFNGFDFIESKTFFVTAIILFLPAYMIIGSINTFLGLHFERWIDQLLIFINVKSQEHPVDKILANFSNVREVITELYPDLENVSPEWQADAVFEKCRIILYQKEFSARAQSIAIQATFYRNLVPVFLIIFIFLLIALFFSGDCIHPLIHQYSVCLIPISSLFLIISRWRSQKLYLQWFWEVLNNIDAYFKTSKITKS